MKISESLGLLLLAVTVTTARAQVYSQNIVGYINLSLSAGNNLIANQLCDSDNSLNTLFSTDVPEGATFTEWDPGVQQYLPASTYDTISGWSINYTLDLGQGGLLNTPSAFTSTIVGSVWSGFDPSVPFVPPLVGGSGNVLLSCVIPIAGATFYDVIGHDPENGESVTTLNPLTQLSTITTFENGVWDNGAPALDVGQAAFFNLGGATPAPEPAVGELAGVGLLCLTLMGRRHRRA